MVRSRYCNLHVVVIYNQMSVLRTGHGLLPPLIDLTAMQGPRSKVKSGRADKLKILFQ